MGTLLVGLVGVAALSGAAMVNYAAPVFTAQAAIPVEITAPAAPTPMPWMATAQGALSIPALGVSLAQPHQHPVPIASITKLMAAYVVLQHLPLALGQSGPTIVVNADDVADYRATVAQDGSNAAVRLGERLDEFQLLDGFLVHSASNYAEMLVRMLGISQAAFVNQMNAQAKALHMGATHYVEPTGYQPANVSTPVDQLVLAAKLMGYPVVARIVAQSEVNLPVAGVLGSYVPLITTPGVIGVKSGYTHQAGGCDVMAFAATHDGQRITILAATFGIQGAQVLARSGLASLALVRRAEADLVTATLPAGTTVGTISSSASTSNVTTTTTVSTTLWPGQSAVATWSPIVPSTGVPAGTPVGTVSFAAGSLARLTTVSTSSELTEPNMLRRVV